MRQLNIDELKAKLPEGIWLITGGSLKMQRLFRKTYFGEELEKRLTRSKAAMKLHLKDNILWVTIIQTDGNVDTSSLDQQHAGFYIQEDGDIHLLMENKAKLIYGKTIEESIKKVIESGAITKEEYEKYKNPDSWDNLPKIEFEIVSSL